MSILVTLDKLTQAHWKLIRQELWIKPKPSYFKRQRFGYSDGNEAKPIVLYQKQETQGVVALPFTYANCLLNKFLVTSVDYPKLEFQFTSKLWEKQVLVAEEAVAQLNSYHTTTLWLPCGFGKTVISAYLAARIKRRILVTFKLVTLKKQWWETFKEFTDARIWIVNEEPCPDTPPDVILCTVLQVCKVPLHWLDSVGTLILDEVHELCTPVYSRSVISVSPCYIIACTATPIRENGAHKVLYAICGTHYVYRAPDKQLTAYKVLTGIKFTMGVKPNGDPDWAGLCREVAQCEVRNLMIQKLVHMFWKRKIVILTIRVDHAIILEKLMKTTESVESMTANDKSYKPCRVLTGTFAKIGTAFDEKTLCEYFDGMRIDTLIMAGSTKSKTWIMQALGRAFRSDRPMVLDLIDENGTHDRHWKVKRAIYNKLKAKIVEVPIDDMEQYGNGPRPMPKPEYVILPIAGEPVFIIESSELENQGFADDTDNRLSIADVINRPPPVFIIEG